MAPPLPAPFSTCPTSHGPALPPEHVAVDIPAAAFARLVVVKDEGPTPPPPQPEHAKKNHPTAAAAARPDPFARTLFQAMWAAYLLMFGPVTLFASSYVYGGEAALMLAAVFFLGVITGLLFHVREDDEGKEAQVEAKA